MNRSSEYSSGCESGWTTYFDQLSNFTATCSRTCITTCEEKGGFMIEDQDEDLSTVSDATSGPSNLQKHRDMKKGKKKTSSKDTLSEKQQRLLLDDTASSPTNNFSQNGSMTPYNYHEDIFAAAYLEDESTSKKQTSLPKYCKKKSGGSLGRKRQ